MKQVVKMSWENILKAPYDVQDRVRANAKEYINGWAEKYLDDKLDKEIEEMKLRFSNHPSGINQSKDFWPIIIDDFYGMAQEELTKFKNIFGVELIQDILSELYKTTVRMEKSTSNHIISIWKTKGRRY